MGSIVKDEILDVDSLPNTASTVVAHSEDNIENRGNNSCPASTGIKKKSRRKKMKSNNGGVVEADAAEVVAESTCSITPSASTQPPSGSGGGANTLTTATTTTTNSRRIFTPDFKQSVLEAYTSDPDCIGNQRATARKFNIHRRQVQKWLTQLDKDGDGSHSSSPERILNQESLSNCSIPGRSSNNSPSSSSSNERDREVRQPLFQDSSSIPGVKDSQTDLWLSPSSSSSNSSKVPVDLCTMTSAAMAMSLNLSHTPTSNSVIMTNNLAHSKQAFHHNQHHSDRSRSRNNSSPSPIPMHPHNTHIVPSSIPSPNSLLAKFYSLYAHAGQRDSSVRSTSTLKYQGINGEPSNKGNGHFGTVHQNKGPNPRPNNRRQSNGIATSSPYSHHIQILDEIAAAYPHDDFNLLRQALLRNEVSFTKVSSSTPKSTFFPPMEVSPESNGRNWRSNGKERDRSRTSSPTTMSPKNPNNHITNNALELHRQQSDYCSPSYIRLLQQSALNFPDLSAEGLQGSNSTSPSPKYPWLASFAQAQAALGLPVLPTQPPINGHRKQSPQPHVFVSPKPPSNSKPKTVAAALAATRSSPNSLLSQFAATGAFDTGNGNGRGSNGGIRKRSTAPRKRGKPRQNSKPSCTITRPSQQTNIDEAEYLDPTSMLELTHAASESMANGFGYPGLNGDHSGNHLLRSMLQQQSDEEGNRNNESSPEDQEILKKYLEQNERKSPSSGEQDGEQVTKAVALDAFTYDPEVAGDCRAVARKFGLNVRVVMKWIKESAAKTNQQQQMNNIYENNYGPRPINGNGDIYNNPDHYARNQREDRQIIKLNGGGNHDEDPRRIYSPILPTPTSSNKRKNSKPNQICDFQQEMEDDDMGFNDGPLDMMMVPIKKRRVSSQE